MAARRLAILGSRGIPARYGGFETFAQEIATRLVDSGMDVTVFCENGGPPKYENVQLTYVPAKRLGPLTTVVFDLRCLWRARKGFDIVYMLGYGSSLFCFLPRLWGSSVWINMDGIEWRRSKWTLPARTWLKVMEWFATKTASRLIVDADAIGEHLRSRYVRLPKISMIPYGAAEPKRLPDDTFVRQLGLKAKSYNLIVCRLEPENHVLEIVQGYSSSSTDTPLVVVGGLPLENSYVRHLMKYEASTIRFVGSVYETEQIWSLRYNCRIYFHGHSVGGTNPSLLEAMAAGNLVLAHDNIFNREVLGRNGYYFEDAQHLAKLVQHLMSLDDDIVREKMNEVRDRVRMRYSWDSVRDAYLKLISES